MTMGLPGVEPGAIRYGLARIQLVRAATLGSNDDAFDARFRRAQPLYCSRWLSPGMRWDTYWRYIPAVLLTGVFSFDEVCQIWHESTIDSKLAKHIERQHQLLWKVSNSQWRYGWGQNYNQLADHVDGLGRLSMADFDVRIVWAPTYQAYSWAMQAPDIYLDASMGMLLYHGGRHVLTVGFAPSSYGILVAQVQLREKRGNRFLYRLGRHYLDAVLDMMHAAFGDQLWLVNGRSAADAVRRSYGGSVCSMGPEAEARVVALYDRELDDFDRGTETATFFGRTYMRLCRRKSQNAAA